MLSKPELDVQLGRVKDLPGDFVMIGDGPFRALARAAHGRGVVAHAVLVDPRQYNVSSYPGASRFWFADDELPDVSIALAIADEHTTMDHQNWIRKHLVTGGVFFLGSTEDSAKRPRRDFGWGRDQSGAGYDTKKESVSRPATDAAETEDLG